MFLKAAFLLLLALSAYAQPQPGAYGPTPYASWTGTTTGAPTFLQPNTNAGGAGCAAITTPLTTYMAFNTTFPISGVRQVILLAESAFKPNVAVLLYGAATNPFNPAASCTNFIRRLGNVNFPSELYGSLTIDDSYNFLSTLTYVFVVTSVSSAVTNTNGIFGLQIVPSLVTGTSGAGIVWIPSNLNAGVCTNTVPPTPQNASVFTFTSGQEGYYDVVVAFEAAGIAYPSTYISIYEGTFTAAQVVNGSCSPTLNSSLVISAPEGDRHAVGFAQFFKSFITYTAVVSTSYAANWGFQYFPTRGVVVTASGYTQPNRVTGACTPSSSANAAFAVANIPMAVGAYTLVETNVIPSYNARFTNFPTFSFAYNGSLSTTAPTSCPTGLSVVAFAGTGGNTTGPLVIPTTPGKPYGVVISTSDGGQLPVPTTIKVPGAFVYVIASLTNNTATTTTTTTTTGGASTTGGLTSTTGRNATSTITTDAAAIGVPMLLVAAAALLQLFM